MTYYKLPQGVQDLLPEECYNLNLLKKKLGRKFELAGCIPVSSASIEYYDTFTCIKNSIPQDRMFKMTDRDGRLLVLLPDMTLSVARIAATRLKDTAVKLSYISDVWNYSAEESASQREIFQAGVEFLGVSSPLSDAQTIAFAIECIKETGINDFIIDIGHVGFFKGLLSASDLNEEQIENIRLGVNAKDSISVQMALKEVGKEASEAIMALPALFGGEEVFERAEKLTDNPDALNSLNHLKKVYAILKSFGLEKYISVDLGTVKSLSYYSGVVFTGYVKDFGSEVLSGGRYDELSGEFGKNIPAVGFAMGLKRILMVLERQGLLKKLPSSDLILLCEEGAESNAYSVYNAFVNQGRIVDFFTGSLEEGKKYAEYKNAEVYIATKEGLKSL